MESEQKGVDFGRLREAARSTGGRSHPVMSWGDVLLDCPGRTPPAFPLGVHREPHMACTIAHLALWD
ncbi:hypothetical protein Ddc_16420 [Ditylenchus destructor]|nr:hypothetical protein Ddc_16420 [Ditylenchus destructor]